MAQESAEEPRDLYTIPISSSWFDWDEIHETERRALPEFFDGSSISRNPRVYKEYRDFIISRYREAPSRRLTFTEVRKSLVGDAGSLHKVFLFLDRCGLINFGAQKVSRRAGSDAGPVVVVEEGAPSGVQVVPAPTPPNAFSAPPAAAAVAGENGLKLPPLTSYSDVFGDSFPVKGPTCGTFKDMFTQGQHEYVEGSFGKSSKFSENNNMEQETAADSESKDQIDADGDQVTNAWTDAETLLLLEAVLKHRDDWDLIAQHVRTKNKLDCIGRLIQLPFGEHMLGTIGGRSENRSSSSMTTDVNSAKHARSELPQDPSKVQHYMDADKVSRDSALIHPSKRRCFPFVDATDSLMKQVALLSTVAGPHVAAAAAEAAVLALCNENPYAAGAFDIDDSETTERPSSVNNNVRESDTRFENPELERHQVAGMPESVQEDNFALMTFRMRAAIATALGAAAARAKLLADQEEREMEHLMASIIETQMKKIQYKMKHFEELELIMQKEYTQLQQLNESIIEDWASVLQQTFRAGIPGWKDHGVPKSLFNSIL